ncbi:hypothetical protein C0033_13750 [Clostridium sp. chh4-2]|uniref:hypothetical protein n=1 Tax=Clostridium sp. chh4-2 TaxID=2067550 RepID=UPI000CCF2DAE|nr:hypothetical protein [Clostridium sp. chh4-2]PNV61356.1 hypothetical protein C0033_13750 [Clostridium sp. chh4-2]
MKKPVNYLFTAVLVTALSGLTLVPAFGKSRTEIDYVSLDFSSDIEVGESGGTVDVTANGGDYYVDDVEILNDVDEWDDNDRPKVKVYLSAESDCYFSADRKSDFDLNGEGATYVSSSTQDSKTVLILTVKLDKLEGSGDLYVDGLELNDSSGEASWEENSYAKYYQVRLYRNGNSCSSIYKVEDTFFDFSSDITRKGDYSFQVRGVRNSSERGDWNESDSVYIDAETADELSYGNSSKPGSSSSSFSSNGPGQSSSGAWLKDTVGWWYCNADRTYTRNNWQYINNKWYFFNENGYMVTGWVLWKDKYYYLGEDGAMYTNRMTPDHYYVNGDGVWIP